MAMRVRRRLSAAVAVVVAMATVQPLFGSLEEYGEELFREGVRIASAGDYAGALAYFERTFAYAPRLNVLWNIACCHVVLGHRNLAVACLDRYMEHDVAFQESAEMQTVVAAIEAEPPDMPDAHRRAELWRAIEAANRAVEEGRATVATADQRRYGVSGRGAALKNRGGGAGTAEREQAAILLSQALGLLRGGHRREAMELNERSLLYQPRPNVFYNLGLFHLELGHRDIALAFWDRYLNLRPVERQSPEVQAAVAAIADAPSQIDESRARELLGRLAYAIDATIPPTPTPAARPPVRPDLGEDRRSSP
jgi:tetratricopeptide (TPR) repeat protein